MLYHCSRQRPGSASLWHGIRRVLGHITCGCYNAFNILNRQVALHIICLCPSIATILINLYRSPTELLVDGDVILSQEGTTQGG